MELRKQTTWRVIGLMSGTSLDGLDMACVDFTRNEKGEWSFDWVATAAKDFPSELREALRAVYAGSAAQLVVLDHAYAQFVGKEINSFLAANQLSARSINLIASHGQTIFHRPDLGYTLQIGNGYEIAALTGIDVVCDFRTQDVALGGQGAPLVPIGDALLFAAYDACVNIGGFSNISFAQADKRIAFDVSPVNIVLNALSQDIGLAYDRDGAIARSGRVDQALLAQFNALSYYQLAPPKSLGFEWVQEQITPLLEQSGLNTHDLIATYTEHASQQLAMVIKQYDFKTILFTGGGAHNHYFMERVAVLSGIAVKSAEAQLIDQKEALVFAYLGLLKALGEVNVLASVTGAKHDHCSGLYIQL